MRRIKFKNDFGIEVIMEVDLNIKIKFGEKATSIKGLINRRKIKKGLPKYTDLFEKFLCSIIEEELKRQDKDEGKTREIKTTLG